jgi:hypothetical protein
VCVRVCVCVCVCVVCVCVVVRVCRKGVADAETTRQRFGTLLLAQVCVVTLFTPWQLCAPPPLAYTLRAAAFCALLAS